jgi:phenylalanyl-tRNA synthetase alpha chain
MIELEQITKQAEEDIAAATELAALEALRVEYLGKKGQLTGLLKGLGALSAEERPAAGAKINEAKQRLTALINERKQNLESEVLNQKLAQETRSWRSHGWLTPCDANYGAHSGIFHQCGLQR